MTGRISGLFRDTMPAAVSLMDKAVLLAASLPEKEEDNFIRKHVLSESSAMEKNGMTTEEAWREACYRIFGDAPGTYGAGVGALLESRNWDSLDDLSRVLSDGAVMPTAAVLKEPINRSCLKNVCPAWM